MVLTKTMPSVETDDYERCLKTGKARQASTLLDSIKNSLETTPDSGEVHGTLNASSALEKGPAVQRRHLPNRAQAKRRHGKKQVTVKKVVLHIADS